MLWKIIFLYFFHYAVKCEKDKLTIGAILYENESDVESALNHFANESTFVDVIVRTIPRGNILIVGEAVCDLVTRKVIGIIDGTQDRSSEHIQAICDMLEIPHVMLYQNDLQDPNWSALNLYPSSITYNLIIESIIIDKDWQSFTILYAKGYSLSNVEALMNMGNATDRYVVTVRELSGNDYRDVLTSAKKSGFTNFVVDCPPSRLEQLLKHAQQVGLMADEHSYIFVSPDLFSLDLSPYRYGGVNMTGFRLMQIDNPSLWTFSSVQNKKVEEFKTDVILAGDAVQIFSEAVQSLKKILAEELSCTSLKPWNYGFSLLNFMKTNKVKGLTRSLNFDGLGRRTDFVFDVLELTPAGNQTIGKWENGKYTKDRRFIRSGEITDQFIMRNKTFKILIAIVAPYAYERQSPELLVGNERYEGFTIDLIEEIANILGFNYEFEKEVSYGEYNRETGKWNGMVQQLREEKADFAICDFTITASRQSAIDFSTPFMTLGVGILYKEPSKQPPEMFSFMAVFSKEVWINMLLVQLGLGTLLIFVSRLSHKEWQNPVPCIEQPEELTNQFSFGNSIWLIIGSVMQQGSEIAPIALAPRLITSVWWFFTMVMVASYTGTLVAFLTVEDNVMPFNNINELHKSKLEYGAKRKGTTIQFFEDVSNGYRDMYLKMRDKKWLVEDNEIGVKKAENSSYAFFMESTSIEYYIARHCDLRQVGGLLDSKSYGIGMKAGSPYKKFIDKAVLYLKESGVLQKLKDLWWEEKMGGGQCTDKKKDVTKELGMKNMIGAFVVLAAGCVIGLLISTLDMLWGVFKRSLKYNTNYRDELIAELKFAIKFSGDIKPVNRPKPLLLKDSAEVLANLETKDEVRSLRSARSTDSHRTHHSHKSRHSSRSQSVAFARRRDYY